MRFLRFAAIALMAVCLAPPTEVFAGDEEPGHKEFVSALVGAINSQDISQRRALLHSGSRHCAIDTATEQRDVASRRQASNAIPADYRWGATALPATAPLMFTEKFDYPVRPTHIVQLLYERNPRQSTTLVVQIARDGADWREVVPCVKPAALEEMRVARTERAKQMERVETLLAQMRPELKDEIVKMVRDGRKVDAIKHYRAAVGEDLSIAKYVVDRVTETVTVQ